MIIETIPYNSFDFRNVIPCFSKENQKANQVLVDLLDKIASDKNATPVFLN